MADSLVAGWLSEIGLEGVIPTFREVRCPKPRLRARPWSLAATPPSPAVPALLVAEAGAGVCLMAVCGGFGQEGIDSEALAALDDSQLKELGVKRMGDRTKVITHGCPKDVLVLPDLREPHMLTLEPRAPVVEGQGDGHRPACSFRQPARSPSAFGTAARERRIRGRRSWG
jgi:hypothetical protein